MLYLYTYNPHKNNHTLKNSFELEKNLLTYEFYSEHLAGQSILKLNYRMYNGYTTNFDYLPTEKYFSWRSVHWYDLTQEKLIHWQNYLLTLQSQIFVYNADMNIIGYNRVKLSTCQKYWIVNNMVSSIIQLSPYL